MRSLLIAVASVSGLLVVAPPLLAQESSVTSQVGAKPYQGAATPGTPGEAPLSRNGAGPDSTITGTSEGGRGGTGGAGGILSNGTSDNAGTATGGPAGGNPTTGASGGGN